VEEVVDARMATVEGKLDALIRQLARAGAELTKP
jgi:hypothetical protein